jgi:orotate phosphoribosyltransferase
LNYLKRVKEVVKIKERRILKESEIWDILETSKAIIFDGHFEFLSTKHSDTFFRFDLIRKYPYILSQISKELIENLKYNKLFSEIDVVLSPISQGRYFANAIKNELSKTNKEIRVAYTLVNKDTGHPETKLMGGYKINADEKVLIVNDIATTGKGLSNLISCVKNNKANVLGVRVFANRGKDEKKIKEISKKYNFSFILELNLESWPKNKCTEKCSSERKLLMAKDINQLPMYSKINEYKLYVDCLFPKE